MFRSLRAKLQAVFFVLGLSAIGLTGWEASAGAVAALEEATHERLTAIRQTRCRQVERYFRDLAAHATALAADESVLSALEAFHGAWSGARPATEGEERNLHEFYAKLDQGMRSWFPRDRRSIAQQNELVAMNPYPAGAKGQLLEAQGVYGQAHSRYHPTFHRYQKAFGFYDIFLVDAENRRVVYTVSKEIDFGILLGEAPYRDSALGRVVDKAMSIGESDGWVLSDYEPYVPSSLAPAAFIAAPLFRAGARVGILVMQVSIDEVNRVMTNDQHWQDEGLGRSGQAYAVGADDRLRSDMRLRLEDPERYYAELLRAGISPAVVEEVKRHGTAILRLKVMLEAAGSRRRPPGTELSTDLRGVSVLRSHAPLAVEGLDWTLVAEIETEEMLAPVRALRWRILGLGSLIGLGFLAAAGWLAGTLTRPIRALAAGLDRLGHRDFSTTLKMGGRDEIGQLGASFNRIARELARTTVSKEELERLAGQLITAQEDERRRIARELHDGVTQQLASLTIEASILGRLPLEDGVRRAEGLARIREQAARLTDDVHRLSRNLHPALLDDLGLAAAVEQECRGFFDRGGPPVDFECSGDFTGLRREVQIALYRIAQEGLRNIEKHGGAQNVSLRLEKTDRIHLRIVDDGRGFEMNAPDWRRGLGLRSMEERVRLLGGKVEVKSQPGKGTEVDVWVS
ncbi:MAG: HAMP domain-containing protein [Bryobacter sp.]|nr:HAMP domain-containing protein [Bryobacter sp. CoA8 C33]